MADLRDAGPPVLQRPARNLVEWTESVHPVVKDAPLVVVLAGTLLIDLARVELPPDGPFRPADPLGYLLVALLIAPLVLRTVYPMPVFVTVLGVSAAVAVLLYAPTSYGFGLIVATYSVGRWCERSVSLWAFALAQLFAVGIKLRAFAAGIDIAWFEWPLDAAYFGAAWFLGDAMRNQRRYAAALERSREALAHRAVQEERNRIARELHDAMGHSLSVMVLHAGGASEVLDRDAARARQALGSITSVGSAALREMDRLVGFLREGDGPVPSLRPSLSNLDRLADEFRDLGLDVHVDVSGPPTAVPVGVDLSAFRIIQEALTNTLKHAGPTRADVTVTYCDRDLAIAVEDRGRKPGSRPVGRDPHTGRGLIGMRERVALLNGALEIDEPPGGGFAVSAVLPLEGSAQP